ncbi:MAG: carbohydrate ABC transporter substrate-binding protein [Ruminococcaceae bacterium]|nr:carbohydrate ABC transporter substrate-binding protein [Oscillospiraceae bacterium]
MQKRMISLFLLLIIFSVIFPGCDWNKNKTVSSEEKVHISFSFWESSLGTDTEIALSKIIENYNQIHPEVEIELISRPVGGYQDWIKEQFASNNAPTIIGNSPPSIMNYYKQGLTYDFNDVLNQKTPYSDCLWKELYVDRNFAEEWKGLALPWYELGVAYFYNMDIYEQLGLSVPETWNDFMYNCEIIQKAGIAPITTMAQKEDALVWLGWHIATGMLGDLEKDESAKNPDGTIKKELFLQQKEIFWKELKRYVSFAPNAIQTDEAEAKEIFLAGDAAHILTGTWDVKRLVKENGSQNRMGIFRLPVFTKENSPYAGKNPFIGGPHALGLNRNITEEQKNAAIDFLQFFFSEEQYRIFIEQTMQVPILKSFEIDEIYAPFFGDIRMVEGVIFTDRTLDVSYMLSILSGIEFDYRTEAEKCYETYLEGKRRKDEENEKNTQNT